MEIINKLGFDASQAIAELTKLDNALLNLQTALQNTGKTAGQFGTASANIGKQLQRIGDSSTTAANQVGQNVQRMTTSLALLSRVVFTQAIVRGLSTLRNSFKATANDAADFQRSISLIQTIDDSRQSADDLSKAVRDLSNEFNIPLLEASAGVYQAISNQVGSAAESLEFAGKSAEFAKATNSSLANSVDLLSGVLKSYNLNVSETDRISSVFFKTIDLGRVEANELANAFGRVGPRAKDMGISTEETGAALASLTVRGLKTNEAITQLSGIMSALSKPSEAMKEALQRLGVDSGEAAIRAFGLFGTLERLKGATSGSAAEMAKLFPNVRALGGATSLLGDGLKSATANLAEMNAVGRDFAHGRYLQSIANDGERVRKEFNEIKNVFTTEIGGALLESTKQFLGMTDATSNLTDTIKFATPAVGSITAAIGLLIGQLAAAKLGAAGLATGLGALALIPAAMAGGELIGASINETRTEAAIGSIKALHDANAKEVEDFRKAQQSKVDAANAADQARVISARTAAAQISAALSATEIATQLDSDSGVTALEETFGRQITTMRDYVAALEVATQKTAEFRTQQANAALAQKQTVEIQEELGHALDRLGDRGLTDVAGLAVFGDGLQAVSQLRNQIHELANSTSVSEEQMESLRQQFLSFVQSVDSASGKQFFLDDVQQLQQAYQLLQQLQQAQTQSVVDPNLPIYLSKLEQTLALNPAGQFGQATQAMNLAVGPTAAIAANWERAAAAAERAARAAASGGATNQAFGGMMHLAEGGFASRGVDTIPAMLSPGEFVVNARSSRKFFSQLQAINAGQTPSFRENGGSVTNVGDTTINVNGARDPSVTGSEVIRLINRTQRHGTNRIR
ncbi:phage tail tape measure protein [Lacipirellula parvula]|uniref:Phage tail tape measure protein domain-containing protein n=1 Tax=Lacipirellula parvula TaxID=2650471 RepID=A0A5K7X4F5_9BACT|nr:phage tail tape measure protein [Lacipirellula parvula]BBO31564.1 hypothetical protein PLANPX_1176 [Lacipirellula parvula]